MISIRLENGKRQAEAFCDECGVGFKWEATPPSSFREVHELLHKDGWRTGTQQICVMCKED